MFPLKPQTPLFFKCSYRVYINRNFELIIIFSLFGNSLEIFDIVRLWLIQYLTTFKLTSKTNAERKQTTNVLMITRMTRTNRIQILILLIRYWPMSFRNRNSSLEMVSTSSQQKRNGNFLVVAQRINSKLVAIQCVSMCS